MPGLLTVIPEVIQGVNANSVLGNNTGSAGQCVEMTAAQTRALLGLDTTDSPTFADITISATDTASSGTALSGQLTNTYNQGGTAGSTDLLINRTEQALGSGSHYFADFQVGGSKKLAIDNSGNLFSYNSYTDASNNEYLEAGFDANVAYLRTVANGTGTLRDLKLLGQNIDMECDTLQITYTGDSPTKTASRAIQWSGDSNPRFVLDQTDATAGNRMYDIVAAGEEFRIRLLNDAVSAATNIIAVARTGNTIDSITIGGDTVFANGATQEMNLTTSDDGFINFKATADADATSAISTLTTSGATTHHVQVEINGTKAWIAVSTNPPS